MNQTPRRNRWKGHAAGVVAVLGLAMACLVAAAGPAAAAGPVFVVDPTTNLSDGQHVAVAAVSLHPDTPYVLEQCTQAGCDGSYSVAAPTDGSGSFGIPQPLDFVVRQNITVNGQGVTCIYAGNCYLVATGGGETPYPPYAQLSFGVVPTITYTGPMSGDLNDPVLFSSYVTDPSGNPLAGVEVVYGGIPNPPPLCTAISDATGVASCWSTPLTGSLVPGGHPGWTVIGTSAGPIIGFTVNPEETVSTYTGPTSAVLNTTVELSGQLTTDSDPNPPPSGTPPVPVAGAAMTLSFGSQSCAATTDAAGVGHCSVTVSQPVGPVTASASFAGNVDYLSSQANATAAIIAATPGGAAAFVIGDRNATVGANVTFWGSKWAKSNSLSLGASPTSFKGYATSTSPGACGAMWSKPGNSSKPPATVPAYLAVLVTSSTTKTGSTITGNTTAIAIVKTNPGYGPNPGNAGTGTIVAVLPC